jgi:hypothetical protein
MIRKTSKYFVMAAMIGFASYGNAGTAAVTPALAACSKALFETLAKAETLPAYTVKSPRQFESSLLDPNSFTVLAHNTKTNELLAKASCRATSKGQIISFQSIPLKS